MAYLFSTILLFWVMAPNSLDTKELIFEIENIQSAKGTMRIGVFDNAQAFPDDAKAFRGYTFDVTQTGTMRLSVKDLPLGDYAIAFHHDVNDDGKLDKNFFGVPTEPYTFSNNPTSKWRQPKFEEVLFSFTVNKQVLSVRLQRWQDL